MNKAAINERDLLYRIEQLISECTGGKSTALARVRPYDRKRDGSGGSRADPSKLSIF